MTLYMSSMGDAVAAAVLTALATTTVLELTVKPWLEARNARIKEAIQARYRLAGQANIILAACERLEAAEQVRETNTTTVEVERDGRIIQQTHFAGHQASTEGRRWWEQLDEATRVMVDTYEGGGFSLKWATLRELLAEYALTARWVCVSELPDAAKLSYLRVLTQPAQAIFFSNGPGWLRSVTSGKVQGHTPAQLRAAIEMIKRENVLGVERPTIWDLVRPSEPLPDGESSSP
jgi:hypothetical protein